MTTSTKYGNYPLEKAVNTIGGVFGGVGCSEKDVIRQPLIERELQCLEKQIAELGEQWNRCRSKIEPIISPVPACPPQQCEKEQECSTPLARRIMILRGSLFNITDAIRETTNQIEL